ncbi:MAG: Flp pilus assembly protein CpaB, partial [Novosphingobium sp.]
MAHQALSPALDGSSKMNRICKIATIAAVGCTLGAAFSSPALAHHSFAMFDQTKVNEKDNATVAEFRFTNPHSFVVLNVKDGGTVTRYVFECSSVNMMSRAGWKFNTLKAGDKVDVILTRVLKDKLVRSETILENIRVLAIDSTTAGEQEAKNLSPQRTATLELSLNQSEIVIQAQKIGSIALALRSAEDSEEV